MTRFAEALIILSGLVLVGGFLSWMVYREGSSGFVALGFTALAVIGFAILLSA